MGPSYSYSSRTGIMSNALLLFCFYFFIQSGRHLPVSAQVTVENSETCLVEFVVDEELSRVALSANVIRPVPISFSILGNEYISQGIRGSFQAEIQGSCPTSGEELAAAVESRGLTLVSSPFLEFYPRNGLTLEASSFGTTLVLNDVGFNASLGVSPEGNIAGGVLDAITSSGVVFSKSLLVPQGENLTMVGLSSLGSATGVDVGVNGNEVVLNITDFNITLNAPYESEIGPAIDGLNVYKFLGSVVLKTVVGCDMSTCSPHGRCSADDNGVAVCQCGCGWSGPSCNVTSGFCSEYGSGSNSNLMLTASCPIPEPCPTVDNSSQIGQTASCNPMFQRNDKVLGACVCKEGWDGPRCESCMEDSSCGSLYDTMNAECSNAIVYSSDTVFKSYTCDLEGTGLESTIVPGTFYVTCNTTSADVISDGSYCLVNFAMQQYSDNPITCKASLCSFKANQSAVNCQTTSCTCERDCPDLAGVFEKIENRPALIDCDEAYQCTFDIENFFVKLVAPCKNAECRVQGYNFEDGSYEISSDRWLDPFLASIPLIILLGINAALVGFLLRHKSLYFFSSQGDVLQKSHQDVASVTTPQAGNPSTIKTLKFQDVTVSIGSKDTKRILLNRVSGEAEIGKVTGVMGPSGSGKTTLISFLSQRPAASNIDSKGVVLLDNTLLTDEHSKFIGVCPQDSFLIPTLTVYETILYSAILRLPDDTPSEELHRVTNMAVSRVGLEDVKRSYVGGTSKIRGISGGERRRVSVALEIVTNPKILLLDEPTSGLDSSSAKQVIFTLKSVAESGCIVMLSLHQPSPAIFNMLDTVFLLSNGHCMYHGAPDRVEEYFSSIGVQKPPGDGVAEFMLECASDKSFVASLIASSDHSNPKISDDSEDNVCDLEEQSKQGSFFSSNEGKKLFAESSIARELATLTWRNGLDMLRNPSLIILHWLLAIGMGIFTGCVFFQVGLDTSGAQNRAGGLIFALAFFAFTSLTTVDLVFHEKTIVDREVSSGYYRRWTYVISKLVLDGLLLRFIPILLYSASFYPMMGLDSASASVALYLMTLGTFAVAVGALSLSMTFLSNTPGQASFIMNIILLISLLNSGFFVNVDNMPDWISWLRYLSVFFYSYSVLISNEVFSLLFNFVVSGYTAVENVRGVTFLQILGIDPYSSTNFIIILDCMYAIFAILCLIFSYITIRGIIETMKRVVSGRKN